MPHSRVDDLCSEPDCPEPHMLEAMAACMATEGYGAFDEPGAALTAWRGGIVWSRVDREWWLRKARAALRGLEFAGVTVTP